jgi:hypothetical protein
MHFLHIYVSPKIAGVIEYGTLQCLPANRQEDFLRKKKRLKISGIKNAEVQAYLASSGRFLIKDKEEPADSSWTPPFFLSLSLHRVTISHFIFLEVPSSGRPRRTYTSYKLARTDRWRDKPLVGCALHDRSHS